MKIIWKIIIRQIIISKEKTGIKNHILGWKVKKGFDYLNGRQLQDSTDGSSELLKEDVENKKFLMFKKYEKDRQRYYYFVGH